MPAIYPSSLTSRSDDRKPARETPPAGRRPSACLETARDCYSAARLLERRRVLGDDCPREFDARLGQISGLRLPDVSPHRLVLDEHPLEDDIAPSVSSTITIEHDDQDADRAA